MSLRRIGAAAAVVAGVIALVAIALNWLVVREAGDTAGDEVGAITGKTPCPKANGSSRRVTSFAQRPPRCIKQGKAYVAEVRTSAGPVTIALDARRAPLAVNNFVVLARYHFYDGAALDHGPIVQTSPSDPGYTIGDERPAAGSYEVGSVAMASTGPGTSGSRFFIVVGDVDLVPIYPLFGAVTAGLDALRTAAVIESIEIRES